MKVLVTGGAGFIGSNITKELLRLGGYQVRVIDNLCTGNTENLKNVLDDIEFSVGDIRDDHFVKKNVSGIEVIFHQAALPSVQRSIEDPATTNDVNISGTLNILMAAKEQNIKRFVYASSSSIYGDSPRLPKSEKMAVNPKSPYALSKYTGEKYCQLFYNLFHLETICLRYFNVFGPGQDPASQYAAVIPKFISAISDNEPLEIYGDGEQTRDFTFVGNVVEANILAGLSSEGAGEVINIACGNRTSLNRLAGFLMQELGNRVEIIYSSERKGDVRHSIADISKAMKLLRYEPGIDIWEGLRKSVPWYIG